MEDTFVDGVRGLHLLFLALGMGAAFYLDFRTLTGLSRIIRKQDIAEIERIHRFVSVALAGLWVTGLTLIWIRTSFDLGQFSPKLWCKLAIVTGMTLNAMIIGTKILPIMQAQLGRRLIDLRPRSLMPLAVVASVSMFFWINGLALGSSTVLKTAGWELLMSWLSLTYVAVMAGGIVTLFTLRTTMLWMSPRPDPFDKLVWAQQVGKAPA